MKEFFISNLPFIIIYLIVLCVYFYTETSGKMKLRAPNKIILATLFLGYAIYMYVTKHQINSLSTLLMIAVFLSWLGDVYLLIDFGRGGDFFLCGNVCFIAYEIAIFQSNGILFSKWWWVLLLIAILLVFCLIVNLKSPKFNIGSMKWPLYMYIASITISGMLGVGLLVSFVGLPLMYLGIGTLLFMISDYLLMTYKFVLKGNKWILRGNSCTYFIGLLLIVLSMGM